jgi:periplasmic glucans biosynthesis protein
MKYSSRFDVETDRPTHLLRPAARALIAIVLLWPTVGTAAKSTTSFDLADVAAIAQKLAKAPFREAPKVPKWLTEISYDQWRDIRFRPEMALWQTPKEKQKPRFSVQFFHAGLFYEHPVAVHFVDGRGPHPILFSPALFDYGKNDFASRVPQDLGFAGFRIHYPINKPDYADEVIVFLGASYFRSLGKNQSFGLSARGLAIDTAMPSGEEFPFFKEFWLVRPAPDAAELVIYALLDSVRVTGAYKFVVKPGDQTVVEVQSRLFPRKEIGKLGIAPLTSMFFYGENTLRKFIDFRPEVHDSDGVLLNFATGEWMWRPIDNPETLHVSGFRMPNPRGFGLLQRDREFDHYQEIETRSDIRPSAWIVPKGDWGDGHFEVVEIPTKNEVNDNIATFWVPAKRPNPTEPLSFDYDLYWYGDDKERPPGGRAVATRRDLGTKDGAQRFIIEFEGPKLKALPADTVVRGMITAGAGTEIGDELLEEHVVKNPVSGGWRLGFQVRPKDNQPLELRAFLQKGDEALTETWSYTLRP